MLLLRLLWVKLKNITMTELNFILKGLALGTHTTPWDLKVLLFKGATNVRRKLLIVANSEN